jgi:hypothetical protein
VSAIQVHQELHPMTDTNNTGIKIRYKYRFDSDSEFCSGCTSYPDGTSYGGIYVSTNELNNRTVSSGFETGKEVYQDQFASRFFRFYPTSAADMSSRIQVEKYNHFQ